MNDYEIYNILLSEGYIPNKSNLEKAKAILNEASSEDADFHGDIDNNNKFKGTFIHKKAKQIKNKQKASDDVNPDEREGLAKGPKSDKLGLKILRGAGKVALSALMGAGMSKGLELTGALKSDLAKKVSMGVGAGVMGAGGLATAIDDERRRDPKYVAIKKANQKPPTEGQEQKVMTVKTTDGQTHKVILKASNGKWVVAESGTKELPDNVPNPEHPDNKPKPEDSQPKEEQHAESEEK